MKTLPRWWCWATREWTPIHPPVDSTSIAKSLPLAPAKMRRVSSCGQSSGVSFECAAAGKANSPCPSTDAMNTHGIELDGVEVHRLRLPRSDVPEPGSVALVLLAPGLLPRARRPAATAAESIG
jgi:hypothetical protein